MALRYADNQGEADCRPRSAVIPERAGAVTPATGEKSMNVKRDRRPFVAAAALWMLAAAALTPSGRADDRSVRRELEALYAQEARILKQGERYQLKRFLLDHTTNDYRLKTEGGKMMSREDTAANLEEGPMAAARFTGQEFRILKLSVKGDEAVVLFKDRTTAVIEDPQGNAHKIVNMSNTRDTWVKTPDGWKTRLTEVLSSKTLLDGKEIKPQRARSRGPSQRR